MQATKIEWTDFSANPLKYRDQDGSIVWACVKCSDGCKNCYSEAITLRYNRGKAFTLANIKTVTPYVCEKECRQLIKSKKLSGKRVFIGDMTDVFGEWVPTELIYRLMVVFAYRRNVVYQVLTKRPQRAAELLREMASDSEIHRDRWDDARRWLIKEVLTGAADRKSMGPREYVGVIMAHTRFPLENLWIGSSAENQGTYLERDLHLREVPAVVRFWSLEPLLGPIVMADAWTPEWTITGCESNGSRVGRNAEDVNMHMQSIVEQRLAANAPCFVKQIAGANDRVEHDVEKFPKPLQVRQFP